MTITIHCPHCKQPLAIAPRKPGSRMDCPACGQNVVVPGREIDSKGAAGAAASVPATTSPSQVSRPPADRAAPSVGTREARRLATSSAQTTDKAHEPEAAPVAASAPRMPGALAESVPPVGGSVPEQTGVLPMAQPSVLMSSLSYDAVVLPKSVVILLIVFALVAVGSAFCAGYLFGSLGSDPVGVAPAGTAPIERPALAARGAGGRNMPDKLGRSRAATSELAARAAAGISHGRLVHLGAYGNDR